MKILILGTRGIPNRYGGFEQCAEKLAYHWSQKGCDVGVYCVADHPYKGSKWRGIKRILVPSWERYLGPWGTLLYDFLCLIDALRRSPDVILNLGYVPAGAFFPLRKLKKISCFITNMDGLEWQRTKWSNMKRKFAKYCEKQAIIWSDYLIADNLGIEYYLKTNYNITCLRYIPYGAEIIHKKEISTISSFKVLPFKYYLIISRLEPENNIEAILK